MTRCQEILGAANPKWKGNVVAVAALRVADIVTKLRTSYTYVGAG